MTQPCDPAAIARFTRDLAALWPQPKTRRGADSDQTGVLALAVSGGPDSLALLLLAHAALPGRVAAASVDHGLRAASADEAAAVARICAALGVPHTTLPVAVAQGNVQAKARDARYAALAGWMEAGAMTALATGHHADDSAETLLMRLNRGSGVAGLAGVRVRGPLPGSGGDKWVLRPLLGWRRAELAALVAQAGLTPADDPSNRNPAYDRARLRGEMARADWLDVSAIATSAGHLADADAALEWAAAREFTECVSPDGLGLAYRPQAPRAVALRVMARILARLDNDAANGPRGSTLARAFDALLAGETVSIGAVVARPTGHGWSFTPAAPRRAGVAQKVRSEG